MSGPVTNHALLRYLERVEQVDVGAYGESLTAMHFAGVPVNAARAKLTEIVLQAVALGAKSIIRGGLEYVIADGVLVTIKPRNRGGLRHAGKGKMLKAAAGNRGRQDRWNGRGVEPAPEAFQ